MTKLYTYNNPEMSNAEGDMKRYNISKSTVDYFHYKQYRYTTLTEAINQAKRDASAAQQPPAETS